MTLNELFNTDQYPEVNIEDIMEDSRKKVKNSIFFSLQGLTHDGHQFISQAIDNGAVAIVHSRELKNKKKGITYIFDENLNDNYAQYVNDFFHEPSKKLHLVGITGTNGKTTIAALIQAILNTQKSSAYMGTLGVKYGNHDLDSNLTTNNIVETQRHLNDMVNEGVKVCAMEASSQGIDLGRIEGLQFEYAVFTNLTQDHLDYHLNMESYYQAKKQLFTQIDQNKTVVINIDDEYGLRLSKEIVNPVISVSMNDESARAYIEDYTMDINSSHFTLRFEGQSYPITTNLIGHYNVMNLAQAMMICHLEGMSFTDMQDVVLALPPIAGRMQVLESDLDFSVMIDFAHSPDSMEKILSFAKSIVKEDGRVVSVFGSAGRRDKSKRKKMGEVADKYSDLIYITEDDPRDEKVMDICEEIASGVFTHPYVIIESRHAAIHFAIQSANRNDIIIIMGKGPETTIAIGNQDLPYETDAQLALDAIAELRKELYEEY